MKNKQSLQIQSAESGFKLIDSMPVSLLQIKFSERRNTLYGQADVFGRLFNMCRHAEYAETARSSDPDDGAGVLTGRWVCDKIRDIRHDHILKRCQKMVDRTVRRMRRQGMFRMHVDIAIDKHLVCGYDKFSKIVNTIKSKYKNGTCDFNCLATANCTTDGSRTFLAARLVRWGDANADVVSGLISDCKKKSEGIRSMKVDREFFSVGMINLLESLKILFMVSAIKTRSVKKAVKEFESGTREAVLRHFIESDCGRADFTLIIQKRDDGYFTLATRPRCRKSSVQIRQPRGCGGIRRTVPPPRGGWRLRTGITNPSASVRQVRTSPCGSCCCSSRYFSTTCGHWSGTCFNTLARART